jgi:hypothetical protein
MAMKTLTIALFAATGLLLSGCGKSEQDLAPKKTDFGTGLNTVEKTYEATPVRLIEVVSGALKGYDLTMESDRHDDLGGEITARRADGSKVTAKITARDEASSEVSIRVSPGNKNLAEMIHARIAEKVGALDAK